MDVVCLFVLLVLYADVGLLYFATDSRIPGVSPWVRRIEMAISLHLLHDAGDRSRVFKTRRDHATANLDQYRVSFLDHEYLGVRIFCMARWNDKQPVAGKSLLRLGDRVWPVCRVGFLERTHRPVFE